MSTVLREHLPPTVIPDPHVPPRGAQFRKDAHAEVVPEARKKNGPGSDAHPHMLPGFFILVDALPNSSGLRGTVIEAENAETRLGSGPFPRARDARAGPE
jgi:hypothetical protein